MTNLNDPIDVSSPRHDVDLKDLRSMFEVADAAPTMFAPDVFAQVKIASSSTSTGFKFPTTTGFTQQGNNHNQWTNPTNAYADDATYTTAVDGATRLAQSYGDFSFGIPTGATITGVIIKVQGKISAGTAIIEFGYGTDRTGGVTNYVPASQWTTTEAEDTYGSSTNNLGITTGAQMADGNFFFRLRTPGINTGSTYSLDCVQVNVYYTVSSLYLYNNKADTWLTNTLT